MTQETWDRLTRPEQDAYRTAHKAWPTDPTGNLQRFMDSRRRVIVHFKDGTVERGYIGRSTGWSPCWLLVKTARSYGGAPLNADDIASIHPTPAYRTR